jgi:hypothetical protein
MLLSIGTSLQIGDGITSRSVDVRRRRGSLSLEVSKDDHCQENTDANRHCRLRRTIETADLRLRHEPSEVVRHEQDLPKGMAKLCALADA